jgi:signal transduction histidine kinase
MKVLIVDGSKERRRDLTLALAELTNVVIQGAVPDVRSALSALAEISPDVIVTDVTLPDGDGTYLIERIRGLSRTPAVIVLANRSNDEQREHYLNVGADSYLAGEDFAGVRAAVLGLAATRHAIGSIPPQETQRLLGRMTAGVVHDFNNYIHIADVALELMDRQGPQPDLLTSVREALDAMYRLNTMLLNYARGGLPTTAPVDMGDVVRDTVGVMRRVIPQNVEVATVVVEGIRPVLGVRAELEQVVLNLVINACDAMPSGGRVDITVKQCTLQAVMIEVSDNGTGFAQTSSSTKPGRGPGIGLTIVRSVIARQGGAIRILARQGGGTTVAVMLPTSQNLPARERD